MLGSCAACVFARAEPSALTASAAQDGYYTRASTEMVDYDPPALASCLTCPLGARCSSGRISAEKGFWGVEVCTNCAFLRRQMPLGRSL